MTNNCKDGHYLQNSGIPIAIGRRKSDCHIFRTAVSGTVAGAPTVASIPAIASIVAVEYLLLLFYLLLQASPAAVASMMFLLSLLLLSTLLLPMFVQCCWLPSLEPLLLLLSQMC
jgi:hypothetical protein